MNIEGWLKQLGLERYAAAFRENDVDLDVLPDLSEADLERLGVTLGHRKKILRAVGALPAMPPVQPAGTAASPPVPTPGFAERRHLTVLFCDLVGSTDLAARLDPEDMTAIYRSYRECCERVVTRWEGHLDHFQGDGAVIFFGYPQAHEDDAVRAAHAGLELVRRVSAIRPEGVEQAALRVRVGIATGLVLAGDLFVNARLGGVVGDTTNMAARLQSLAEPGQVVTGAQTQRLLGRGFETRSLGWHRLKGFADPLEVWAVQSPAKRGVSRFEMRAAGRLTPFIGREGEIATLLRLWRTAKTGAGQLALLHGEAGIGKSRILHEFTDRVTREPIERFVLHCSPYHTSSAWHPVSESIERAAEISARDSADERAAKLETLLQHTGLDLDTTLPLIARMMSIEVPDRPLPSGLTPQMIRARTIEALASWTRSVAEGRPLLLTVEDAHWLDASSKEFLEAVAEMLPALPVFLLVTSRRSEMPRWAGRDNFTEMTVGRLDASAACAMIKGSPRSGVLAPEVAKRLIAKADGVPLFLEELTRMASEQTAPAGSDAAALPSEIGIPDTLKDLLAARLDRLGPAKEVAQTGAVIGREFGHDLLSRAMDVAPDELSRMLPALVEAELVFAVGRGGPPRYVFKHALVRDAAYDSLPKQRRRTLHRRVAEVLESDFATLASARPELLAQHYAGAGLAEQAVDNWLRAGRRAIESSALVEAAEQLRQGLRQFAKLGKPSGEDRREIELWQALAPTLLVTKGYASDEARQAFERLRGLCERTKAGPELFLALRGLWAFRFVRADLPAASEIADQLLSLAGVDDALALEAHRAIGMTALYQGRFASAAAHLEKGASIYDRDRHHVHAFRYGNDPGVVCLSYGAKALWCLGRTEEALANSRKAQALARELDHPFSRSQALCLGGMLAQHCGDVARVTRLAEKAITAAQAYSFRYWMAVGAILRAWAAAQDAPGPDPVADLAEGLESYRASGAELAVPWFTALSAEATARAGDTDGAIRLLDQAEARSEATGEQYYVAEILRLRGALLAAEAPERAETFFRRALLVAEGQQAGGWARRVRVSLARHLAERRRGDEARAALHAALDGVTPGTANPDIDAARTLLAALD